MKPSASTTIVRGHHPHRGLRPPLPVRNPLGSFFAPKSIAIIGATERSGSVGRAVMVNLAAFSGPVFPVNPKHKTVLNRPAFASISALPAVPDLAVIVTPAASVPGIIAECARTGVPSAVILSAGFKETGPQGCELEQRVLAEAQRGPMRVLGPNCLGLMIPQTGLNASFAKGLARAGNVAFLSQSGALCTAVLDWSIRENVGFSAFVSIGSMADVGWGDLITYFGDDPGTKSIVCYMESVGDARSFLSAAREVALTKPIIVLKVGHTEAAAKAAASHTGALTGSDAVLDAAFRRVGILRVNTLGELFDMAKVLAKQPRPAGPRLAIVTNAGGPGVLATDALVGAGGSLAALGESTRRALDAFLPPHWSHGNPVDILGDADAARYAQAARLALDDPQTDGLLVILTPQAMTDAAGTAARLAELARDHQKPILASWMGGRSLDAAKAALNAANIPTFDMPDAATRAFALMWDYSNRLRTLYETPSLGSWKLENDSVDPVRSLLETALQSGRTLLTEQESKQVLAAAGIPVVETHLARSAEEAVKQAATLGYPVVVKLHSETITHKSDVQGVVLDVRNATAVRNTWHAIEQAVAERHGPGHFQGVTVQPMVSREGYELILGSTVDPQFGPVISFGAGGQLVEVNKDVAIGLPPLNATLAVRLLEQTRIYTALKGVRGRLPVDLAALKDLMVRFSQLVAQHTRIAEIDINPLLASPDRLVALDARIILHPSTIPEARLPRTAIRPYPQQYVTTVTTRNGAHLVIRPVRPEDEPLMVKFHGTLSERSVYFRYFSQMKLDERITHERLSRTCFLDYDREMALVALHEGKAGEMEIVAVGRLSRLHGANAAEFALLVSDAWQGKGLGTLLLKQLVQIARDAHLTSIRAVILPDNHEMLRVAEEVGFTVTHPKDAGECDAELLL